MDDEAFKEYVEDELPDLHFDVLIRCWDVPVVNEHIADCCGSHYEGLRLLSIKDTVHSLIRKCQTKVDDLISQQRDVVRVACCDDHGIHRSYAMATLLQGICEAKKCEATNRKKYNTQGPHHLDAARWAATVCTTCEYCRPSDNKYLFFRRKAIYW